MNLFNFFKKKEKPTPVPYKVATSKVYAEYIQKIEDLIIYYIDNELGEKKLLLRNDVYNWLLDKSELLKTGSDHVYIFDSSTYGQIGDLFSLPEYQLATYADCLYEEPLSILAENEKGKQDLYDLLRIGNFDHLNIEGKKSIVSKLNNEIINKYDCYIDPCTVLSDYFRTINNLMNSNDMHLTSQITLAVYASEINAKMKINDMIYTTLLKIIRYQDMGKDENKGVSFLINTIKNLILHVTDEHMDEICTQNSSEIYWKKNKHKELKKVIIKYDSNIGVKLIMETDELIITYNSQRFWLDEDLEIEDHNRVNIYKKDCQTIDFLDCNFESSSEGIETLEMYLCGDKILTYNSFKYDINKLFKIIIYRHDDEIERLKLKLNGSLYKKIKLA